MKRLKIIFVCLLATFSISVTAQKQQFKKADSHYKSKNYSQAIPLYIEGLAIKSNLSKLTKLANCYRKINQMDKAEAVYAQIVRKPKAKTQVYFNYAETLMSNEKYDKAKYWFEQYHKFHPEKGKGKLMADACEKIKFIKPYFPNAGVLRFSQNSAGDDTAPVFYNGGIVFSSDRKMGAKLLKQKSGTTGRDFINIYFSKEENGQFKKPKKYSKFNELNKNTANFSYKADSTLAVFSRNSKVTNRKNAFTLQLFQAESSNGKKWKNTQEIEFCRIAYNYMHPALSPDGQWLYFVSDVPGGNGGTDIYVSKRKDDGTWGRPQNLGPQINTSNNEGFPYFHKDGKLYFCSKGHTGYGGFDIFFSQKSPSTGEWSTPVNVGQPINSASDDISIFIDQEDHRGLFTSSRAGGDDDIYLFWLNGLPDSLQVEEAMETVAENTDVETEMEINTPDQTTLTTNVETPAPKNEGTVKVEETLATTPQMETLQVEKKVELNNPETTLSTTNVETPVLTKEVEVEMKTKVEEKIPPIPQPELETVVEKVDIPTIETASPIKEEGNIQSTVKEEIISPIVATESITASIDTVVSSPIETAPIMETTKKMDVPIAVPSEYAPQANDVVAPVEVPEVVPNSPSPKVEEIKEKEAPRTNNAPESDPFESRIVSTNTLLVSQPASNQPKETNIAPAPVANEVVKMSAPTAATPSATNDFRDIATLTHSAVRFSQLKKDVKKKRLTTDRSYRMDNLSFEIGSYLILPPAEDAIAPLLQLLKKNPNLKVEVACHTYSIGSSPINLSLSKNRAIAIRRYLAKEGIALSRVKAVGYGEAFILNQCTEGVACTQEEHAENERVEISILEY